MIAEASGYADRGQHSASFALAVDDGELEVFGRDRLVRPASHVRLAVEQALAYVASVRSAREIKRRVLSAEKLWL